MLKHCLASPLESLLRGLSDEDVFDIVSIGVFHLVCGKGRGTYDPSSCDIGREGIFANTIFTSMLVTANGTEGENTNHHTHPSQQTIPK